MNFDRELDARKGELIESLQELIRIKSVGEEAGAHPFGDGPHACLMACLALGERLGFRTASVDDMAGYVEFGTGEEMVAVLGHLDVVPEGDGWKYPPYGAVIDNGSTYGRCGAVCAQSHCGFRIAAFTPHPRHLWPERGKGLALY